MDIKKKYTGIQSQAKAEADELALLGREGCLFLCICSIAEEFNKAYHTGREVDILRCYLDWRAKGYIGSEFFCKDQCAMLEDATGFKWEKNVVQKLPVTVPECMYTVEKWKSDKTGFTHFKRRWGDTLYSSNTVNVGRLECYYTYTVQMQ